MEGRQGFLEYKRILWGARGCLRGGLHSILTVLRNFGVSELLFEDDFRQEKRKCLNDDTLDGLEYVQIWEASRLSRQRNSGGLVFGMKGMEDVSRVYQERSKAFSVSPRLRRPGAPNPAQ